MIRWNVVEYFTAGDWVGIGLFCWTFVAIANYSASKLIGIGRWYYRAVLNPPSDDCSGSDDRFSERRRAQ